MKARIITKVKELPKVEAGSILIAQPFWKEEIYQRVVALVLEHTSSGTSGILLNKKSNLMIVEALPSLNIVKPLFYGGGNETKIISYLHSNGDIPDSIYLGNNLFWGGSFDALAEIVMDGKFNLDELSFFAGFTHWSSGQLEDEINNNKWWVSELDSNDLFSLSADELWSESLGIAGNIYSLFGNVPDPSLS